MLETTYSYQLASNPIDQKNESQTLTLIIQRLLEAAQFHDRQIQEKGGLDLLVEDQSWVITQNRGELLKRMDVKLPSLIKTSIVQANRFFVTRYFEWIQEEQVCMQAFIQFAILNLRSRQMERVPHQIIQENNLLVEGMTARFEKISFKDNWKCYSRVDQAILDSAIDHNQHVNNLVYLEWVWERLPEFILKHYTLQSFAVKYHKELYPGDAVQLESWIDNRTETLAIDSKTDQTVTYHRVYRQFEIVCQIKLNWQINPEIV
ncbi:acyl-ACP thioesterase domain-containing protein [Facklamia hominis]|uniref:Thioesterase n=1 Tax=Facklamia hominis TaxID=178214 RepID=A0AAJ1V629_9LACT|nr:acyl-ACP thioesterase domain-containing protein [Facklamia hominis]MDK7187834.1 thioesterase [Facklamia hominis]